MKTWKKNVSPTATKTRAGAATHKRVSSTDHASFFIPIKTVTCYISKRDHSLPYHDCIHRIITRRYTLQQDFLILRTYVRHHAGAARVSHLLVQGRTPPSALEITSAPWNSSIRQSIQFRNGSSTFTIPHGIFQHAVHQFWSHKITLNAQTFSALNSTRLVIS